MSSTQGTAPTAHPDFWKKCNSCKKPIRYRALYWVCNVSTCNRKRLGLVFCTTACWDAHLPMMNHRESWAEERKAPSHEEYVQQLKEESEPVKRERKPKAETAAPADEKGDAGAGSGAPVASPRVIVRRTSK